MLFYFACEAAGASAPGIPHALLGRKLTCTTRAHSRRENAEVCVAVRRMPIDVVIASAAKQSSFLLSLTMDCFAALAMTLPRAARRIGPCVRRDDMVFLPRPPLTTPRPA